MITQTTYRSKCQKPAFLMFRKFRFSPGSMPPDPLLYYAQKSNYTPLKGEKKHTNSNVSLQKKIIFSKKNGMSLAFDGTLACSRLQDGGEKSFSKKQCKKCAGAGERQGGRACKHFSRRHRLLSQVACVLFSLCSF